MKMIDSRAISGWTHSKELENVIDMTLNLYELDAYSSHSVLTLSERGFKRLDSYRSQGDHYVHLKVRVPLNLTEEQVSPIITFFPLAFSG